MSNNRFYIVSNHSTPYLTTNIREEPNTNSKTISNLTNVGSVVKFVEDRMIGNFVWSNYILPAGVSGWIRSDVHDRVKLQDAVLIQTPFVSQEDFDSDQHVNDCGIACALMLIKKYKPDVNATVENLANSLGMSRWELTRLEDIENLLNRYEVPFENIRPFNLAMGLNALNSGRAYIALVNYKYIKKNRSFPHFIVVIGYDNDYIYINDPLDYSNKKIPFISFANAISKTQEQGNLPFRAFVEI